jgi:hypothetical protein
MFQDIKMLRLKSYCPNPGCNHSAAMESFDKKLKISQRRALVMAHPDYLYRSSTGYYFRDGIAPPLTLRRAFERCFKPFRVTMHGKMFAVSPCAKVT